ncbi:hypothetical protein [Streptomyces werraensis]|uniref:hypothetical protein n=1 Tax=Streptomyces werraensis TaxID=68284 RepID=UPI0036AD5792
MGYERVRARVVRAGLHTAHVAIDAFAGGQITIPIPTRELTDVTKLTCQQLAGTELTVTANVSATVDTDVHPYDWQLLTPTTEVPAARWCAG